jgi:Fe-S oxidoreductase
MIEFREYLKRNGKEAGIYGHAGSGAMHLRPYLDLRSEDDVKLMQKMMLDVTDMLLKYGGALSGEHGDGLLRSWLNRKLFGERIYEAFVLLKQAFDPDNIMNPGKVIGDHPVNEDLRLNPKSEIYEVETFLDFSKEGGFSLSADMCNGNGSCRKTTGTMCPSFQATRDEYDSTRARAQTLRSIIHRKLPLEDLSGKAMYDILDLCIECKGCKKECPSQVDMAKMKSEVLYQYQEKHGYSLRNRMIASLSTLSSINSLFPSLYNWMIQFKWIKRIMGFAEQRNLPKLAKNRFSHQSHIGENPVILFSDTYTEFYHPEIGESAKRVLEKLGYSVIILSWECCGRPLISKGFLKQAKSQAEKVVELLHPYSDHPIIVLEPSCLSAIQDDYEGILGYGHEKLQKVMKGCVSFDSFIDGKIDKQDSNQKVQLHGHCHQKALTGTASAHRVLKALGCTVEEIPSGCCGMAGSFGYEKEHYDISMKIGELQLFPTIRSGKEIKWIVANGVSCRTQIQDGTGRQALHLAEIVDKLL